MTREMVLGLKVNTVHLIILMLRATSIRTLLSFWRRRTGNLLCCRLTPRGRRWPRLETTRSARISCSIASWNLFFCRGGNSTGEGQLAADHPHGVKEGEAIGVFTGLQ